MKIKLKSPETLEINRSRGLVVMTSRLHREGRRFDSCRDHSEKMNPSQIYILIAIVGLLLIVLALFIIKKNKKKPRLTPLTSLAFAFIIAGIVFGDNRLTGYTLIGTGVLLAIIDIIIKLKKKRK